MCGMTNKGTGKICGVARLVTKQGFFMEGWVENSQMNGYGRMIYQTGAYSIGMFKQSKMDGQCLFVGPNGQ